MLSDDLLRRGLGLTLAETNFPALGQLQRGKVRDCYVAGDQRTIIVTDRLSAFDRAIGTIPFKGQVLNGISAFWFRRTGAVCPNHLLDVPDPCVSLVRECAPFPVEMVVRGYLTGSSPTSIWTHYARGERTYCGHRLPAGMRQHERLPVPLVTPTTKATGGGHDEPLSAAEIVSGGLVGKDVLEELSALALALFAHGQAWATARGLVLADTKYEFGRLPDGRVALIDEVHTPDSSRYWYADSYEHALSHGGDPRALDKEYVRRYLSERGFRGEGEVPPLPDEVRMEAARRYIEIYEQLTAHPFEPALDPPQERLARLAPVLRP